ncbi:MAG: allophanate hydrolase [Propionibacteriales bacterium]|nr:allophanate hydrolase [Propionibacteriales bacterium]
MTGSARLSVEVLRRGYRDGSLTPLEVVDEVLDRIRRRGQDGTWISLVDPGEVRDRAASLDLDQLDALPLLGIPFAVKDNVDVAGLETTAACPGFAYAPERSALLVRRLLDAGAILVGKTNLDQFATGLNGTRSPYGVPESVYGNGLISGGSSSGSAVAVAAGLVTFAIGTDTAGSGRVPAALNGVVGLKPSIGLISADGVVPACRSLDCPSVFSLTVADSALVGSLIVGPDPEDPLSRRLPTVGAVPARLALDGARFAVPRTVEDWGTRGEREAWEEFCAGLVSRGAVLVPLDLTDFLDAGRELYGGAWLAERHQVMAELLAKDPEAVLPVIRTLMAPAPAITGDEVFAAMAAMARRRVAAHAVLDGFDALLTPTCTTTFTVGEVLADPIVTNERLGRFTTFTNLLDLCAVAVPAGLTGAGIPFGVSLQAAAGRDAQLLGWAAAVTGEQGGTDGPGDPDTTELDLAVVGAHLAGMPLHRDLLDRGARLIARTTTSPDYRLFALPDTIPPKPGLRRVVAGGAAIEVEVYRLPAAQIGSFLATVRAPLGLGELSLVDGSRVHGFICEPVALDGARDVTSHGGWRAYLAALR